MKGGKYEKAIAEDIPNHRLWKVLRRPDSRDAGIVHDWIVICKNDISIHSGGENDSGVSAFATGLLAVLQKKERSLLVYISIITGLLLIFFLAGEILSPQ